MLPCSLSIQALVFLGPVVLGQTIPDQGPSLARRAGVADGPASMAVVFEGVVYRADGTPASGARVTSSAGGSAITELDGHYRLAAEVPLDAHSVQLDASGAGGSAPVATTTVTAFASRSSTPVDPLVLGLGASGGPRWLPTFGPAPAVSGGSTSRIKALTVLDDGSRAVLYAAGSFTKVGAVEANNVARWDGHRWSALGGGVNDDVDALAVYDDGGGPALYAAGQFTVAGGAPANHVAKWDGASWSALGSGTSGWVHALTVYDDGSGPALYAAGQFTTAGGVGVNKIARWNGSSWSNLGGGLGSSGSFVFSLSVYDDGNGSALYAGGTFASAGGAPALRIAKWDGTSWSALGSGINGNLSRPVGVYAMSVYDDGSGPALYVGGIFGAAGGVPAAHIARWDGSSWAALGSGLGDQTAGLDEVNALAVFDDGNGPQLCAAGTFGRAGSATVNDIARWDGSAWAAMGDPNMTPQALAVFRSGGVEALHVGGGALRKWDGSSWNGIGNGPTNTVRAVATFDDGGGPAVYVGGAFTTAGNVSANRIARWDGNSWSAPDGGVENSVGASTLVRALAVFDDGGGPALYVGGLFPGAGGVAASSIARWDGSSWSALGSGVNGIVSALAVFDDGGGPALYAGGAFANAGGVAAADRIAKWDGSSWSALGSGVGQGEVNALAVFDDGSGPALHVGGTFTSAGGAPANYIARWDGTSWSPLGDGMNFHVNALAVFDDGGGPQLYSGSSGAPHHIARWNGASWSPVHGGMNAPVRALAVFDDGSGPALFAGGEFTTAGGAAASRVAKYDGTDWWAVGAGMDDTVFALAAIEDGGRPDLYVGGRGGSPDSGDGFLARYGLGPATVASRVRPR